MEDHAVRHGEISVAVVDDPTIRRLHDKYLGLDEPTDVMSFVLEQTDDGPDGKVPGEKLLDGEVIVSIDTARATAASYGWAAEDELLLYVIHGALHLIGYDDTDAENKSVMREKEQTYLARFGLEGHYEIGTDEMNSESLPASQQRRPRER